MIVGTKNIPGILSREPEDQPILLIDANRVVPQPFAIERVETIPGWDVQVIQLRYRIQLVQFTANHRTQTIEGCAGRPCC